MSSAPNIEDSVDAVLGREFLTWLWYRSETAPGSFTDDRGEPFSVTVDRRLVVQGGEGDSPGTTSVSGESSDGVRLPFMEARTGLLSGKKVTRALLSFEQDGMSWQVTIKAEDFSFASLRMPKSSAEEGDDPDAGMLERIWAVERATTFFDRLYADFLAIRLDDNVWSTEVERIAVWMSRKE